MIYGDELCLEVPPDFELEGLPAQQTDALFTAAYPITQFGSAADKQFFHVPAALELNRIQSFRIDGDALLEINDAVLRKNYLIRNEVEDVISLQFSTSVKRSEMLGNKKSTHDLGPALIVTVVPAREITLRAPGQGVRIQHVVICTTFSTLMERLGEQRDEYPAWLQDLLDGKQTTPQQRVYFLDDNHRDSIWPCFHLPVTGSLLSRWMSAKYDELLCIGLQILKDSRNQQELSTTMSKAEKPQLHGEKIRRALAILSMEYANPPSIKRLARQLGMSETQLKSSFKAMSGTTVMRYCINRRMEAACLLLKENRLSIAHIARVIGYDDHSAFSRAFGRYTGQNPRQWRKDQAL